MYIWQLIYSLTANWFTIRLVRELFPKNENFVSKTVIFAHSFVVPVISSIVLGTEQLKISLLKSLFAEYRPFLLSNRIHTNFCCKHLNLFSTH